MTSKFKFTDASLRRLSTDGTYIDDGWKVPGFTLELRVRGDIKTFDLRYRKDGKKCRLGARQFGPHRGRFGRDLTTVGDAHRIANAAVKEIVGKGRDFVAERKASAGSPTVWEAAETYCDSLLETDRDSKHVQARCNAVRRALQHGKDPIARKRLLKVTTADVEAFAERRRIAASQHQRSRKGGRVTAQTARQFLITIFNHFSDIMPRNVARRPKAKHQTKALRLEGDEQKVWTESDIHDRCVMLWNARGCNQNVTDFAKFLMMTGVRKSEALHATWEQINFKDGVWHVPGHQPGNKTAVAIVKPLTKGLLQMLRRRRKQNPKTVHVFESRLGKLYDEAWPNREISISLKQNRPALCEREGLHMTIHDIRRLAVSWCAGVAPEGNLWAIPFILNHARRAGSATDALYAVAEPLEKLRATLQAFENWVIEKASEGQDNTNIVKLRKTA